MGKAGRPRVLEKSEVRRQRCFSLSDEEMKEFEKFRLVFDSNSEILREALKALAEKVL